MKTTSYLILFLALLAGSTTLRATVIPVTSTADSGPGSLRDAIAAAAPGDTVLLNSSLAGSVINLSSGELVVTKNLSIVGLGSTSTAINANSLSRIITINSGTTVLLRGFTLALGLANGVGDAGRGGAILNQGNLTLSDIKALGGRSSVEGGGVYSSGTFSASKSVFKNCESPLGAGLYIASGTMTLFDSKVEDNSGDTGAGIWFGGSGGAFTKGILNRNVATGSGGGLYLASSATLNFSRLTIEANSAGSDGGGIVLTSGVLQISRSLFHANSAVTRGGAVYGAAGSDLQSENSTYSSNSAGTTGGALHINGTLLARANTHTLNSAGSDGGAIYLESAPGLRLIENSVISGNTVASADNDIAFPSRLFSSTYNLYNVISDPLFTPGTGDLIGLPALLDVLASNGGDSKTHALLCGSAAINAANPASTLTLDQRNLPRNIGGRSDMGSFEKQDICPSGCSIDSVLVGVQGACDPVSNTYSQQVTIYSTSAPISGNLVVNGQAFAVSASPQTVTLNGLPSNGSAVTLEAGYSDDSTCVFSLAAAWTAAADCYSCPDQTPSNLQSTFVDATNAVRLSWTPIPGTLACRVSGRPLGAPAFAIGSRIGPAVSQLIIPEINLVNGTSYEWFVVCACEIPPTPASLTNPSVLDTFTYDNGEPVCDAASEPTNLEAAYQSGDGSMLLSWDPPAGMINCRLNFRPFGAPLFGIRSVDGTPPTSYSIPATDLSPGTSYEWKIRCSCSVPPGPGEQTDFSVLDTFVYPTFREALFTGKDKMDLYPNPVSDAFVLELQDLATGDYQVEVFAADGRSVAALRGEAAGGVAVQHQFSVSSWTPGAYWVRVTNADGIYTMNFVKSE